MRLAKAFRFCAPIGDLDNIDTSGPGEHNPDADRGDKVPNGGGKEETEDERIQRETIAANKAREKDEGADKGKTDDADKAKGAEDADKAGLRGKGEATTDEDKDKGVDKEKKGKGVIPVERHERVLQNERERREAAERQLAAYQGAQKIVKVNEEITALEEKQNKLDEDLAKALADGDTAKAATLMRQIRTMDREIAAKNTAVTVAAAEARATETARYDTALERIEEAFPQLNSDHADFDEELAGDVGDLMAVYRQRGMTPAKALQQAVARLVKPTTATQKDATTVTPRVDPDKIKDEVKNDGKSRDEVKADRKADAVDKAIDAHKRTPPSTDDVGKNSDKMGGGLNSKDVSDLSYDKFNKIPEEDLAKVRGDVL